MATGMGVGTGSRLINRDTVARKQPRPQADIWSTGLAAAAHQPCIHARRGGPKVTEKVSFVHERAGRDASSVKGALQLAVRNRGGRVRDGEVHAVAQARHNNDLCGGPTTPREIILTGSL